MTLNPEQLQIVELPVEHTTKVLAGAGTGKTRVLVERYLKLVDRGVAPDRLLALTFTKKAAAEMHTRIFNQVVARGDQSTLRQLYGAWIMNFHQFSFRVIKENAAAFAVDPDVEAASEVDIARIRRALYRRFESGRIGGLPEDYGDDAPIPSKLSSRFDRCISVTEKAKSLLLTPEELMAAVRPEDAPEYRRIVQTVAAVWNGYQQELARRKLLDFSDMIRMVVFALRRDERLRETYRGRFEHILVDEFQDTSEAQNELLRLLAGDRYERVTVVGDEKQSIYRWRDARIENLREFKGEEKYLKRNYRSTQAVLDLAYRFIAKDSYFEKFGDAIHLTAEEAPADVPVCVFHPPDGSEKSFEAEARALAAWILSVTGRVPREAMPYACCREQETPLGFADIAVLMRSLKESSGLPVYEKELERVGIPYAIFGGMSALEHQVLTLFTNQLSLLVYPDDMRSFLGVVEARPFSIPDKALRELFAGGRRSFDVSKLLAAENLAKVESDEARRRLEVLRASLERLDERRHLLDLPDFVSDALEMTQFYYELFEGGADLKLVDSVSKSLVELVDGLVLDNESSVSAFLESMQTLLDERQFGETDTPFFPEGRVRIMTIHQAKGLEFPAVAVPGIKNTRGRSEPFVLVRDRGLYITDAKEWNRAPKHAKDLVDTSSEKAQEERCLLYVAMTRSQRHLFVSSPYANGVEDRDKPNDFASILGALKENRLPHEEVREVPEVGPVRTNEGREAVAQSQLGAVLSEWRAGRDRLEAARAREARLADGVLFVNWRGLHTFAQCPLQYYYRHVAGVDRFDELRDEALRDRDDETEDTFVPRSDLADEENRRKFGILMHRFLYEWMQPDVSSPDDAYEREKHLADIIERSDIGASQKQRVMEKASELVAGFLDTELAAREGVVHLELPMQTRVGNVVFHGIVDRVDRSDGGHVIIDYKGAEERPEHEYQIRFYAWALDKLTGFTVSGGKLCYLRQPTAVQPVSVSARDISRIEVSAKQLNAAVRDHEFPADPGAPCETCSFRSFCPFVAG